MIIVGNRNTTKIIDDYIEKECLINKDLLMENVAFKLLDNMDLTKNHYLIIAGFGNNGGDGYSLARMLYSKGKKVTIFSLKDYKYSNECYNNLKRCEKLDIDFIFSLEDLKEILSKVDIVIDALFGVGLDRELNDFFKQIIYLINKEKLKYKVVSIDIPSGLDSDNGKIYGDCIKADETLSIITYKKGFFNYNSSLYTGKIKIIKDIILTNNELLKLSNIYLVEKSDVKNIEIFRNDSENKTDYGKNFIICGSEKYPGASRLVCEASIRSGCGYTYLLSDFLELRNNCYFIPELIFTNNFDELINSNTIAIGSGVEYSENIKNIVEKYKSNKNMVLDAGAINSNINFSDCKNILLTPHIGEFSKLTNISIDFIKENPIDAIDQYLKNKDNLLILLKGKNTYISDGKKTFIINTGNPYMANAGMGDALTGMISSFNSQGYSLLNSAILGSFMHGFIADELFKEKKIINPTDIINNISKYIKILFN